MKVKIGNRIYNGTEEPIMVILTDSDKQNIGSMLPECTKYCAYPDTTTEEEAIEFMKD